MQFVSEFTLFSKVKLNPFQVNVVHKPSRFLHKASPGVFVVHKASSVLSFLPQKKSIVVLTAFQGQTNVHRSYPAKVLGGYSRYQGCVSCRKSQNATTGKYFMKLIPNTANITARAAPSPGT